MFLDEQKIYTVSELSNVVNDTLSHAVVRVRGEVSDFKRSQNGKFAYFDLKDADARMNCFAMFFQLGAPLEDGMEVVVTGSPGLYVPYGKYTFRVKMVELVGAGALKRAFELVKRKLEQEGLFAEAYKKPLPRFPEKIGLITSREAAAYSDVLRILQNRWRGLEIYFYNVHEQGAEAADEIVDALAYFNAHVPVDVLILTRGGGSLEDLQAFNAEAVCRAIFASKIPVISAVGHERDVTLADLVADQRASTPSNAAEIAVPSCEEIFFALDSSATLLKSAAARLCERWRAALEALHERLSRSKKERGERVALLASRLTAACKRLQSRWRERLAGMEALLATVNPRSILRRGYSITLKNGTMIKDVSRVAKGDEVETVLWRGKFRSIAQ